VQLPYQRRDELALARRAFGAKAAARLAGLEPPERQQRFLEAWARQEAVIKWQGGTRAQALATSSEPWVIDLHPGRGSAGALALDRRALTLCCWQIES